jgi:hypothetical protein
MGRTATCLSVLLLIPVALAADEVLLKGGGKVSGRILSRTDTSIEVDVGAGTVKLPMTSVIRVEEKRSALDDYHERAAALGPTDTAGWLQLAGWASSQGLGTQARTAYERVLAIDPDNADANHALGRVEIDGRWVSQEEGFRARGYVQFEGEWVMPAERDAILRERQAESARLAAEQRAQEAEARAAEAETRAREAETAVPGNAGFPMWWGGYTTWGPGPPMWPTQPIVRPTPPARPSRPSRPPRH